MADDQAAAASSDEEQPERRDPQAVEARLRRLAKQLARRYGHVDPDLLGDDDDFVAAVQLLSDSAGDVIVSLTRDASPFVASIALAAARTHTDLPQSWEKQALLRLRRSPGEIHYALSALGPRARRPVLLDALSHADYYWDEPPLRVSVCGFVDDRIAAGDAVDGEALANKLKAEQEPIVSKLVDGLGDAARAQILQGLRVWRRSLID